MATFVASVSMNDSKPFSTFEEACADFFPRIWAMLEAGTTRQMLDTTCWIAAEDGGKQTALDFYDSRDLAYELGILEDGGVLADPLPKLDKRETNALFFKTAQGKALACAEEVLNNLFAKIREVAAATPA